MSARTVNQNQIFPDKITVKATRARGAQMTAVQCAQVCDNAVDAETYAIQRRLCDVTRRLLLMLMLLYSRHPSHCHHHRLPSCSCSSWNIQVI